MKILWIKDGKAGHVNKARGLLEALRSHLDVELIEYEINWRLPLIKSFLPILGRCGLCMPSGWFFKDLPSEPSVDLIISAGGATLWLNASLSQKLRVPNILLGSPRRIQARHFALIGMHDPPSEQNPYFKFELIPSTVTRERAGQMALAAGLRLHQAWGLILGGDGEGVRWNDQDFIELFDRFCHVARSAGRQIAVATSRRTPQNVERLIREKLKDSDLLVGGAWYHDATESIPLVALMGGCERLWVTADSMSMVHEGIASGRPVCAVYPEPCRLNKRVLANYKQLVSNQRLWLGPIERLETANAANFSQFPKDSTSGFAEVVMDLIKQSKHRTSS